MGGGLAALVVGCGGDDDARSEQTPLPTPTVPNKPTPLPTPTLAPSPTPNPFQTRFETAYAKLPAPLQEAMSASPFYAGNIEIHQAQLAESLFDAAKNINASAPRLWFPMLTVPGSTSQLKGVKFRGFTVDELVATISNQSYDFASLAGRPEDVVVLYASEQGSNENLRRTVDTTKSQLQLGSTYLGGMDLPYKTITIQQISQGDLSFSTGPNLYVRDTDADPTFWPFLIGHELNHVFWAKQVAYNVANLAARRPGPIGFHEGIAEDAGVTGSGYANGFYTRGNANGKLDAELFHQQGVSPQTERSEGAKGYRLVSALRETMGFDAFMQANKLVFSQSFNDGKSLFKIYYDKAPEESKQSVARLVAQSTGISL